MATHRLAYFHSKTQRCRSLFHSHYFLLLVADFAFCFIRFMQALDSSSCVLVLLSALSVTISMVISWCYEITQMSMKNGHLFGSAGWDAKL